MWFNMSQFAPVYHSMREIHSQFARRGELLPYLNSHLHKSGTPASQIHAVIMLSAPLLMVSRRFVSAYQTILETQSLAAVRNVCLIVTVHMIGPA